MAIERRRHRKAEVPKKPLNKSIQVWFPLIDVPVDEMIGQRIAPPIKKRKKAISVA
jgi:hypothetical protein